MQGGSLHRDRIALAVDKRDRPIEISAFRWSSAKTAWSGFPVEAHTLGPSGHLGEFGLDHVLLGLCVGGMGKLQVGDGKTVRRMTSLPGRFTLLGRGFEQNPLTWSGTREMLYVAIGAEQLERFMRHDLDLACLHIDPQYAISDPHVVSLLLNMRDEIQAGCPTGRLYGEALSLALAAYLFGKYSRETVPVDRYGLALSPAQVKRVCEYIRANLARDIGLDELADQVSLSPHYFSMLFKHSLGVSPHHYVLHERIHEAQRLLAAGRMSICEVAISLGFSDQSHFSQVFRKMTGTTPKRYQSTC
jgi:AraC family transcriptional regulator